MSYVINSIPLWIRIAALAICEIIMIYEYAKDKLGNSKVGKWNNKNNDALNMEVKRMNDYEKNCYIFIRNLTEELAQDYDIQYQHTEEFARWNLPEEIALEWIDAEGMINVLECGKCISKETTDVLRKIISAFVLEFEKTNNPVWTHEAMKVSAFWNMQRLNARKVLDKIKA